ncbi:MAG: metallophosphoesterase [Bacilli bacterium]|nr:metallophosphoesterase [Bacilli bacterium]
MKKKLIIILLIILVLIALVLLFNKYFIAHNIKVKEYGIIDKNIPDNYHGLKIVQYSDILYGKSTTLKDLNKLVTKINELKPDIVIFTGDLFIKDIKINEKELNKIKDILSNINAKYAMYAVIGDNDLKYKDSFYQVFQDDYIILDNESSLFYINEDIPIRITGINNTLKEELFSEDDTIYDILITHKPDNIIKLKNKYNLAFAGHSMGGQIKLPFFGSLIKLKGAKTYISGEYNLNDTKLYVNDGIGSQNISMRVNNYPKINFYRLYNK